VLSHHHAVGLNSVGSNLAGFVSALRRLANAYAARSQLPSSFAVMLGGLRIGRGPVADGAVVAESRPAPPCRFRTGLSNCGIRLSPQHSPMFAALLLLLRRRDCHLGLLAADLASCCALA